MAQLYVLVPLDVKLYVNGFDHIFLIIKRKTKKRYRLWIPKV